MQTAAENANFILGLLQSDAEEGSDLQLAALDQLCLLVLQMDSPDSLKKLYPPASYVPVLAHFFLDFSSPASVLESSARVITYYLQILPFETTTCLLDEETLFGSMTFRMTLCDLTDSLENDLAQQIIKVCFTLSFNFKDIGRICQKRSLCA